MKRILSLTLVLSIIALVVLPKLLSGQSKIKKSNVSVLYVGGNPEYESMLNRGNKSPEQMAASTKERMAAYESYLNEYFNKVKVIHGNDYNIELSNQYDVTIFDGRIKPIVAAISDREKGIYKAAQYLPQDFDRPTITIAGVSDNLGRSIGTKNDSYCYCLDADAHSWVKGHQIFRGPFKVNLNIVEKPTPENAYHYPYYYDGEIPNTLPMWSVQTKGYKSDPDMGIGLVSRPWGYLDSPDAEYISSGVCDKTLDAVAIGRHGNFLHWGFVASPAYMTEQAKPVFANAIVYISKFAGKQIIARKYDDRVPTREYIKELKYLITPESHEMMKEMDIKWNERMTQEREEAKAKKARGEQLNPMESSVLNYKSSPPTTYKEHFMKYGVRGGGEELYEMFGMDVAAYHNYYDQNYDYFYGQAPYKLSIDQDIKEMGIPNYDKRVLDEAIKLMESGKDVAKGERILKRYTLQNFATAAEWRAWYKKNHKKLFWTESGGWLFLVKSDDPKANDYSSRLNSK